MSEFRKFLVPYDFSPHARAALATAGDLARRLDATLHLVHVVQPPVYALGYGAYGSATGEPAFDMAEIREEARTALRRVAEEVSKTPEQIELHVVEGRGVADAIREAAAKLGADLIVMGTHGHTGFAHVFLGSVAERTLRGAPCPVLSVRSPEDE